MEMGWITEKPNRYPIFLKTDTEYRTDFYKNRPENRKPTPTQNTDTDPPLKDTGFRKFWWISWISWISIFSRPY